MNNFFFCKVYNTDNFEMTDIFCTIYKEIDKNLGISMISKRNIASKSKLKLCKENNATTNVAA